MSTEQKGPVPGRATSNARSAPGDTPDPYQALEKATKRQSAFGRINQAFQEMLLSSRGGPRPKELAREAAEKPGTSADDLAIRWAKTVKPQRMVVPEGVIISGNMTSGSETEICGRVDGDVTVEGRLYLGPSALVSGSVRAASCKVDGLVEGKVECSQDVELGETGRLNAAVLAGRRVALAGQVYGNVSAGDLVRLSGTATVAGDVRARRFSMEEGALFNGRCTMRLGAQRGEES